MFHKYGLLKNIEIRVLEKGFLQKIYVDEGQYVKAGYFKNITYDV
jgi:hypothetical protein